MRRHRRPSGAFLLLLTGVAAACSSPPSTSSSTGAAARPSSIPVAADSGRTMLPRSTHPFARPELDQGRLDPATQLRSVSLVFQPSPQQKAERDARLAAVQDPSSPLYHRWLTPEQYAARFGASPAAIARVGAWLQTQGFEVEAPSRTATQLFFTGPVAQVEQAFRTEMHWYLVNGERHFAMAKAPSIPSELADVIQGLHGFHSFRPHAPRHALHHDAADALDYKLGSRPSLGPADFAATYDVSPLYAAGIDGTGMNVAIAGQTTIPAKDFTGFRSTFGLSATQPVNILVPGSGNPILSDADVGEADIDTQWSGGVAKNATVQYVYTGDNPSYSVTDAYAYVVNQGLEIAPVVSISYGGCEMGLSMADADASGEVAAAGNLMGLTLLAASGDSGGAGCDQGSVGTSGLQVNMPASLPGVTGVGGSEFPESVLTNAAFWSNDLAVAYPVSGGVSLETAWNDSSSQQIGAGGGGKSIVFPKPFYQQTLTPADGARDVPDVSLTASDYHAAYVVFDSTDFGSKGLGAFGGTSCSSPSFAGIMTLVNQAIVKAGGPAGLGNINPMLYALSQSAPAAFHDIVTGNNIVACQQGTPDCPSTAPYQYGYSAGPGYDLATGLGSIDANNLVDAWMGLTPTSTTLVASATSTTVGTPVTLTATVASTGTASMAGDTVSFTFETYAPTGAGNAADGPDGGVADDAWLLGTVNVTPTTAGNATATLSIAIPPGYDGNADVVAMYSGDKSYLASHSAKTRITVAGSTLAVTPLTGATQPNGTVKFTASGGTPPYRFYIEADSTLDQSNGNYEPAKVDNTGLMTAGPEDGVVALEALDATGATVWLSVTVTGAPLVVDAGSSSGGMDASSGADSGAGVHLDGGSTAADAAISTDGSPEDSGADAGSESSGKSGCSCVVADGDERDSSVGSLAALLLGLVFVTRRRRS